MIQAASKVGLVCAVMAGVLVGPGVSTRAAEQGAVPWANSSMAPLETPPSEDNVARTRRVFGLSQNSADIAEADRAALGMDLVGINLTQAEVDRVRRQDSLVERVSSVVQQLRETPGFSSLFLQRRVSGDRVVFLHTPDMQATAAANLLPKGTAVADWSVMWSLAELTSEYRVLDQARRGLIAGGVNLVSAALDASQDRLLLQIGGGAESPIIADLQRQLPALQVAVIPGLRAKFGSLSREDTGGLGRTPGLRR